METLYIHFDTSIAQGGRYAAELQTYLEGYIKDYHRDKTDIQLTQEKYSDNTQDPGAILAIILGSASIIEIAKGIAMWMQRKPEATISITKDKEKTVIVGTNLTNKNIEQVLGKM
jgi:hypothetical protein